MDGVHETTQRLIEAGAVAVVRSADGDAVAWIAETLVDAGVRALEITLTVPGAVERIGELTRRLGPGHLVGVGSVLTADQARAAIDAGAGYVVSPVFRPAVLRLAAEAGVPAIAGCLTPTEIADATDAGAAIVKVFPADVVGMAFFRGVLAPMPHLRLMPTGGVSLENAGEWLRAGAVAVGVGSALVDREVVASRSTGELRARAERLVASIAWARGGAARREGF